MATTPKPGGLTADHHDFLDENWSAEGSDGDLGRRLKALEARHEALQQELADSYADEASEKKAEELRQKISDLETELAQRSETRNART